MQCWSVVTYLLYRGTYMSWRRTLVFHIITIEGKNSVILKVFSQFWQKFIYIRYKTWRWLITFFTSICPHHDFITPINKTSLYQINQNLWLIFLALFLWPNHQLKLPLVAVDRFWLEDKLLVFLIIGSETYW
jgi:hypothetical protein